MKILDKSIIKAGMKLRPYTRPDGSTTWTRLVDFRDRDTHARFQRLAKEAVDRYLGQEMSKKEDPVSTCQEKKVG